jgi:hypothetical protein
MDLLRGRTVETGFTGELFLSARFEPLRNRQRYNLFLNWQTIVTE